jgi:tRNA dimethylallyltransferase
MAVYRGLDIGTEKPAPSSPRTRPSPRWHLLDLVEPGEEFSVAQFQQAAASALASIRQRGHRALLVGGTGLYHRAVVDGLQLPGRFPAIAAALEAEAAGGQAAVAGLHRRLGTLDPVAASRIDPANRRRIVRALEVTLGSGRGFSTFGPGLGHYPAGRVRLAGLRLERAELARRLADRLDAQLAAGWLDEARELAGRPGGLSRTAAQAIGYRELLEVVSGGRSPASARDAILGRLKAFSRRQEAWFERDPRVCWFEADSPRLAEDVMRYFSAGASDPTSSGACGNEEAAWETGTR